MDSGHREGGGKVRDATALLVDNPGRIRTFLYRQDQEIARPRKREWLDVCGLSAVSAHAECSRDSTGRSRQGFDSRTGFVRW
jgi:hypothetical protein